MKVYLEVAINYYFYLENSINRTDLVAFTKRGEGLKYLMKQITLNHHFCDMQMHCQLSQENQLICMQSN